MPTRFLFSSLTVTNTRSNTVLKLTDLSLLISVLSHSGFCFFWLFRDNGTLQSRMPISRFPRTPSSDVLWRGSSQEPCSCPGCPADPPCRADPRTAPSLALQPSTSSPPEAWRLWPVTSPEPCESVMLCIVVSIFLQDNSFYFASITIPILWYS